jgi:glutaminyl-peptide cyclotransferase
VGAGAAFPDRTGELLLDDHTPWLQRGIPAIDLIDFDYPPFHSVRDDLDAVSPRSLELVGETLVDLLLRMRDETCRRGGPPA